MSSNAFFRIVKCPACEGDSVYSPQNPYRPFCSERCKNHDFGAWANEEHRLAQAPSTEDLIDENLGLELPGTSVPPPSTLQ